MTLHSYPLLKTFKIPQLLLASWLLLLSGHVVSSASVPAFLSLDDISDLFTTEAPIDFGSDTPEELFKTAVEFEWERVLAHDQTQFPFFVCNAEPGMSGYKRNLFISETFGVDDVTTWSANAYNDVDMSCFIMNMGGKNASDSYYAIPDEVRDYTTVNPILQSSKMAEGTVEGMQRQLDYIPTDASDVKRAMFTVTFLPGVVVRGRDPDATAQGDIVTTFIQENTDMVVSSSFFYQMVNDVDHGDVDENTNATENVFEEEDDLEPTERMNFWADALGAGLSSGECTELFEQAKFFHWPLMYDTVTVSLRLGGSLRQGGEAMEASTEQACVWSLIQGFALHHSTAFLEPYVDEEADDDKFLGGGDLGGADVVGKVKDVIDENKDVIEEAKDTVKEKIEENDGKIKDLIEEYSSGTKMSFSMFALSHLVFLALYF